MSAAAEVRPLLDAALASMVAPGYQVKRGLAWREDALLRVVALRRGPAYSSDSVTIDFTVSLGLPGLSVLDKHGATFAFDNGLAGLGRPRTLRQYNGPQDADALGELMTGDVAEGRAWVERWNGPDDVLDTVLAGQAVGHGSASLTAARAAAWAAYLGDTRLNALLDKVRSSAVTDEFLADHLAVIEELARAQSGRE